MALPLTHDDAMVLMPGTSLVYIGGFGSPVEVGFDHYEPPNEFNLVPKIWAKFKAYSHLQWAHREKFALPDSATGVNACGSLLSDILTLVT